jgi:hypothetical protein
MMPCGPRDVNSKGDAMFNRKIALAPCLTTLVGIALAHAAIAQVLPSGETYLPMIGITLGQTLQINLVAYPPDPCFAQMGFLDSNGAFVGRVSEVTLQPGQAASLSIEGASLTSALGQRVELMPQVVVNPNSASVCHATAEVFGDLIGTTTVLAVGTQGYASNPAFGLSHMTIFETARLNIAAFPPDPCNATISFVDGNGSLIGNSLKRVQLASGQAAYLDLKGLTLLSGLGQRASVRPIVTLNSAPPGAAADANVCAVSAEIYDNFDGATDFFYPPGPCNPATGTCALTP